MVHCFGKSAITSRSPVGLEEIRQQTLLDGGIPTQRLLVQDDQEAVELHQELVQHWKHRQTRGAQIYRGIKIPLNFITLFLARKYLEALRQWLKTRTVKVPIIKKSKSHEGKQSL